MDGALGTELERRGVQIVGGCCGIGPIHIEAFSRNRTPAGF
ncbi:MAG: homocysteine S-methyltransferase family protein [Gammaproteobacteria bacterium]|nr:homocysteine S-methyltransferase family protein [Gammaproteobacteria bacterium]